MPKAAMNGVNLYYQVHGDGEPLVLIQGFGGGHEGWFFQTRAFKRYFKVIVFDNRGIGRSDKSPEPYTIRTMADDVIGLLDHLGIEKAHILGMSLGGMVAQEVGINYGSRVNKLVLVCTHAGDRDTSDMHPDMLKSMGIEEGSDVPDIAGIDMNKTFSTIVRLAFNKRLYRMILVPLAQYQIKRTGVGGHMEQMEAVVDHQTADRLHLVESRTLVITGSDDKIISPHSSEDIAAQIPDSRLVKIAGGSHAFSIEMRHRFNSEVLEFLRNG